MMSGRLRTSRAGLELIKSFEGFRETAARLPDGRWIIGYGHVRTAREGLVIVEKDAEDLLLHDIKPAEEAVSTLVYAPLSQGQYDALVSLAFNISPGQFKDSEVLRALNVGDFISAANGFDAWRRARINGRVIVVDALVRRRTVEKAMFLDSATRPVAPTQLVTPEFDPTGYDAAPRRGAEPVARPMSPPAPANEDEAGTIATVDTDIARAVQRLAERPTREDAEVDVQIEEVEFEFEAAPEPEPQPVMEQPVAANQSGSLEDASRAVAQRLARILERAETAIADHQVAQEASEQAAAKAAQQPAAEPVKPVVKAPVVLEDLPDFDAPPPKAAATKATVQPAAIRQDVQRSRKFIDDTETFDPGRDPSEIFAEAVKTEKAVNGRGPSMLNGKMASFVPWIAIAILSVLGLAVGLTQTFRAPDPNNAASTLQGASTVFAVFGLLLVMSIYFLATRARDTD
jgi:GH24 family phage-related lysozyme (muramidase)